MIRWLERHTPVLLKLGIPAVLAGLAAYYYTQVPVPAPAKSTVKITRFQGGGGSGSIISSAPGRSEVLTNRHVCAAMKYGGYVDTTEGVRAQISSMILDTQHDLCLVIVAAKIGTASSIAAESPTLYSAATISGHPRLLPNVISKGHWSSSYSVRLLVDKVKCTDKHKKNPRSAMICLFAGGWPVFRQFDAQVVTATIMGGSSGSGVYNTSDEIGGVAFAGMSKLSYALIVPHGYVVDFLERVASSESVDILIPSNRMDLNKKPVKPTTVLPVAVMHKQLIKKCSATSELDTPAPIAALCETLADVTY